MRLARTANPIHLLLSFAAFVLVAAPGASEAAPSEVRDAMEEVESAIELVSGEGGRCARAVEDDLADAEDDLKRLKRRFRAKTAKKLRRRLKKLASRADDKDCPRKVVKYLRRAAGNLRDALEADEDDDEDDEDDEEDRPRKRRKRVKCWNKKDPGCRNTKNGNSPMSKAAFSSLLRSVRGAKPHVFSMQDVVKSMLGSSHMTSLQLAILVGEFKPHIFPMQDVVKICAPRLVDPQNGGVVSEKFRPHVFPMQDVAQLIGAQRAD